MLGEDGRERDAGRALWEKGCKVGDGETGE